MESWSTHHLYEKAAQNLSLGPERAAELRFYAQNLISQRLPVVFTLGHLSKITGVSYQMLHDTVNRRRETSNYRMFPVRKRSGGKRFIHSVTTDLLTVQRFINQEILQRCQPHPSSFAFHPSGGIRNCASMHCGAKWLFQYDLNDFFYNINEIDVFQIFERMGYRPLLAFEFARLCTTTRLPGPQLGYLDYPDANVDFSKMPYRKFYNIVGVLPQGAPTSPMLSNLAAWNLDEWMYKYAVDHGFVYTRYADDITISAIALPPRHSIGSIHRSLINIIRQAGFKENTKKRRIAGPGSKKVVLGLLVDGPEPRISKETYRRIDRHLYASEKFGLTETAMHEGFDSAFGFFNHLSGLIAFVKDVDRNRWEDFNSRLRKLKMPWDDLH